LPGKRDKMVDKKTATPVGVKIISIFFILIGIVVLIEALGFFVFGGPIFATALSLTGILYVILARIVWKGENWGRIIVIIISLIAFIIWVFNLDSILSYSLRDYLFLITTLSLYSIWYIFAVVYALIAGYLLFNKKAKEFFSH